MKIKKMALQTMTSCCGKFMQSSGYINDKNVAKGDEGINPDIADAILKDKNGAWSKQNAVDLLKFLPDDRTPKGGALNDQQSALKDFLALYDITQNDSALGDKSTWNAVAKLIQNGGANKGEVQEALFGSGKQGKGLLDSTLIGGAKSTKDSTGQYSISPTQNPYLSINAILNRLGVHSSRYPAHNSHFHIYLRPPAVEPIGGKNAPHPLLALDVSNPLDAAPTNNQNSEEIVMLESLFVPYLPLENTPVTTAPIIMVAQASVVTGAMPTNAVGTTKPDMVLGDCEDVQGDMHNPEADQPGTGMEPAESVRQYWAIKFNQKLDVSNAKISVLDSPQHGTIEGFITKSQKSAFEYMPNPGYLGQDKVSFLA